MEFSLPRITIITGHYGTGKTNVAVNLANMLCQQGKQVILVDLDIVNPYFRSADFGKELEKKGVQLIATRYANTNLDIPAITPEVNAIFSNKQAHVILDVGGDDAGAIALGRYASQFAQEESVGMYYVINRYRYLTHEPHEALELLREIEAASRLKACGIINNSNLGKETTLEDIARSMPFAQKTAGLCALPLCFTCVDQALLKDASPAFGPVLPVKIYVCPPWEHPDL